MSVSIIKKYFPSMTSTQEAQMEALGELYPEWNAKINVISRKDIDNLYPNHILHSLAIAKFLNNPLEGTSFIDLGTGGGFPGIPLAVMMPQCRFHLIDRIGKKITVARSIAEAIGLKNVTFQHGDIGECHEKFDFVVSRAVMTLSELIRLTRRNISSRSRNAYSNGLICLKGGDMEDGGELAKEISQVYLPVIDEPVSVYFNEPWFDNKYLIYVDYSK